ncbi:DgyrCDS5161 [Dimorphilus gyrociliatus]|uniref:DgyrCDS5161 n=1 Tax=Dimorphilus gyrociliatus TaxID=2664684 RepID=A0A7I8VIZ9_9ANNE|nr:DgyrCDS5161 [Dimorphilus gyrociliatus]
MDIFKVLIIFGVFSIFKFSEAKKPNIIFILADDYGWQDIGYHSSDIRTPTLDKLAGSGIRLENYYVQPICTPTRSQLMSGRYQIHTGLQHGIIWPTQPNGLPLSDPTVADKLKEAGYSTHMVGKWHLGFYKEEYLPINRGFDSYYGYLTGSEDYYTHKRCGGTPPSNDFYCGLDLRNNKEPVRNETGHYSAELFGEKAIQVIKDHNKNNPLFLYMAFQSVHAPLQVPERYLKYYKHVQDKDRRTYAGMVTAMDEAIFNLTEQLKAKGMWDDTILVFSTDNGGQFHAGGSNWPLRGMKATLWEGGMRGIGFVHSKLIPENRRGTVSKELYHVTDWFPTFVKGVAKGSLNGTKLDGHNIWDSIVHGRVSPRHEILHNIDILTPKSGKPIFPNYFDTSIRAAYRYRDWKIITGNPGAGIWYPKRFATNTSSTLFEKHNEQGKNCWLFNIRDDPEERVDLSLKRPEMVKFLLTRLSLLNETAVPVRYPAADPKANPELHGGVWGPWRK